MAARAKILIFKNNFHKKVLFALFVKFVALEKKAPYGIALTSFCKQALLIYTYLHELLFTCKQTIINSYHLCTYTIYY